MREVCKMIDEAHHYISGDGSDTRSCPSHQRALELLVDVVEGLAAKVIVIDAERAHGAETSEER